MSNVGVLTEVSISRRVHKNIGVTVRLSSLLAGRDSKKTSVTVRLCFFIHKKIHTKNSGNFLQSKTVLYIETILVLY